jgi:5,10-methylenetetrahydromethanopterin reductase
MDASWITTPGFAVFGTRQATQAPTLARAAEAHGFGSAWVVEDYFEPGAFTLAGACAAATSRITIGLGVLNPFTRHPALLAMETAALAGLAPGRVVLGLGASNRRWIEEQMAIPFKAPLRAVRESVEIVRRLLAGDSVTFRGECFQTEAVRLAASPPVPVPIVLGVKGPKALRMAGEIAAGVLCSVLCTPAHVRRVRASVRAGRFAVLGYVPVVVDDDRERARQAVKPLLAHYLGVLHGQSILADAGVTPGRSAPFRDALPGGEPAGHLVTDDLIDTFAVTGSPADCRTALGRWAEAGLDAPVAVIPDRLDPAEQLARLGAEVVPAWRALGCR